MKKISLVLFLAFLLVFRSGLSEEPLIAELWESHRKLVLSERADEVGAKVVRLDGKVMRYLSKTFGEKPAGGRSLFISLHGGGGGPAAMNDGQWRNQIRLYQPKEGIYIAPRAPGNTWDLWHTKDIDGLIDRLIETMVVFEDVNPNKVYLMGYSAGGDGVYQLAPRMSDRFAAASMMAGHPNETSPLGLRNIPFSIQVGALDHAYKRNQVATEWKTKLADLQKADSGGYKHFVEVRKGKQHWMDLEDKVAVPWMAKCERNRFPDRVVWKQDDVTHSRFYWLALPEDQIKARQLVIANRKGQTVAIEKAEDVSSIIIRFNDEMIDFDSKVKIVGPQGNILFNEKLKRDDAVIRKTFEECRDRTIVFSAEVTVDLRKGD